MVIVEKGPYRVRFAKTARDIQAAQALRFQAFAKESETGLDVDQFDDLCEHVLVENTKTDAVMACFRFMHIPAGASVAGSYSAQFYELAKLEKFKGAKLEMGRFCVSPDVTDPNLMRMAMSAITRFVDDQKIEIMFGCSSFKGTEAAAYEDAFALLKERHLAPKRWLPRPKAPRVFEFAKKLRLKKPNLKVANKTLPPLLRTYLTMGGWVSDHAVVDKEMNTLHVFTGVEISAIPPARKRLLRADAA